MIKQSILTALLISVVCLLVISGPIANAMFDFSLEPSVQAAAAAHSYTPQPASPFFLSKVLWIVFGAAISTGIVLTVSRRSHFA